MPTKLKPLADLFKFDRPHFNKLLIFSHLYSVRVSLAIWCFPLDSLYWWPCWNLLIIVEGAIISGSGMNGSTRPYWRPKLRFHFFSCRSIRSIGQHLDSGMNFKSKQSGFGGQDHRETRGALYWISPAILTNPGEAAPVICHIRLKSKTAGACRLYPILR